MSGSVTFRITAPHSEACQGIGWFFPNGWGGVGPIEQRDRRGYRRGKRAGYMPDWFALLCNDPDCGGKAVVPVSLITDHADRLDPSVRRVVR